MTVDFVEEISKKTISFKIDSNTARAIGIFFLKNNDCLCSILLHLSKLPRLLYFYHLTEKGISFFFKINCSRK